MDRGHAKKAQTVSLAGLCVPHCDPPVRDAVPILNIIKKLLRTIPMRFDKPLLVTAVAASLFPVAYADVSEFEFTGYLKNETAIFLKDGQTVGQAKSMLDTEENSAGDVFLLQQQVLQC